MQFALLEILCECRVHVSYYLFGIGPNLEEPKRIWVIRLTVPFFNATSGSYIHIMYLVLSFDRKL